MIENVPARSDNALEEEAAGTVCGPAAAPSSNAADEDGNRSAAAMTASATLPVLFPGRNAQRARYALESGSARERPEQAIHSGQVCVTRILLERPQVELAQLLRRLILIHMPVLIDRRADALVAHQHLPFLQAHPELA